MSMARTAPRLVRIAMAALFGLMSLGHGPVMSFARADGRPHAGHHGMHHAAVTAAQHAPRRGQPSDSETDASDMRRTPASCHSIGCFAAVGTSSGAVPSAGMTLLGRLDAPPPPAAHSTNPEPADPPPRPEV
jgi:hypothetical protein